MQLIWCTYNDSALEWKIFPLVGDLHKDQEKPIEHQTDSRLPLRLTGSRNMWRDKRSNVRAMVNRLGTRHLFITLTQNDASPDLQTIAREDSPGSQASQHHHLTQPIRLSGRPVLDIPVKSILRMDQYLLKFKRLFIYNKENNPFGRRFLLFYKSRVPEAWCNPLQYSSLVEW